ncbi:CYCH1-1 [Linum perenne]
MADFQTSTHRAKWIFTPQELVEKYKTTNQRAKQMLEKCGTTKVEVDADGSVTYPEPQALNTKESDKHSRPKSLSVEEEEFMRATALTYFKRFYLQWSVMELDPKHIMLTCIYTACKIEENHVSAEELGKGISQDHQMILNFELIVLQSLGFDLIVYAPYRPVEGFIHDIEASCYRIVQSINWINVWQDSAIVEVDKIMFTNAPLLFTPGQLALAALRNANEVHGVVDFESWVCIRERDLDVFPSIIEAKSFMQVLFLQVQKYKFPTEKDMKHINRKLKSCWGDDHGSSKKREKKSKHKSHKSSHDSRHAPAPA